MTGINRTQAVVLGFFVFAWLSLAGVLVVSPEIYTEVLKQLPGYGNSYVLLFLILVSGLIGLLAVSVIRRWRWTFWLILIAFTGGALRVPASAAQLGGILPASGPAWYLVLQAVIGLAQVIIALLMFKGYRQAGAWGSFVEQSKPIP